MRTSVWVLGAISLLAGAAAIVACSSADSNKNTYKGSGGGTSQGGGGPGEGGSTTAGSGGGGIPIDASYIDTAPGDATDEGCAAQSASGEVWPLDMYIIMDQSGSMSNTFGAFGTKSKWTAVTEGLTAFFAGQPDTVDMGVGIGFFPLYKVPWSTFAQCPNGDECDDNHVCIYSGASAVCMAKCSTMADCPNGDECMLVDSQNKISVCSNDVCEASEYEKPVVPIGMLSATKQPVIDAMKAHQPVNMTPTGPAMEGALKYAQQYAAGHLDRKVIVVLASDGEPTECPLDGQPNAGINKSKQLAAAAAAANPSVKTFVIATVEAANWIALGACNSIAEAGGTGKALQMKQNQPLADQFQAALDQIKGTAVGCEFKIPETDGGKVDPTKVNVAYSVDSGPEQTIYAVGSEAACDATDGGWYYDDPNAPTSIKLCPASCAAVQQSGHKVDVNIQMGCKTVFMPPK